MEIGQIYDNDVFISYAREDELEALNIYNLLTAEGVAVWLDKKNIYGGQNWKYQIHDGIKTSQIFMPLVSTTSMKKRGYIHAEIRIAEEVLDTIPESDVYVLPVRLDECDVPRSFRKYQWVDLFMENGHAFLIESVHRALDYEHRLSPFGRCVKQVVETFDTNRYIKLYTTKDLLGDMGSQVRDSLGIDCSEPLVAAVAIPCERDYEARIIIAFGNVHLYALMADRPNEKPMPSKMTYLEYSRRIILSNSSLISLATGFKPTTKVIPIPKNKNQEYLTIQLVDLMADIIKFIRIGMTFRGMKYDTYVLPSPNNQVNKYD